MFDAVLFDAVLCIVPLRVRLSPLGSNAEGGEGSEGGVEGREGVGVSRLFLGIGEVINTRQGLSFHAKMLVYVKDNIPNLMFVVPYILVTYMFYSSPTRCTIFFISFLTT
jgi:hypothetical protein